jgi:DNA-3-methyladenine glycosylase II
LRVLSRRDRDLAKILKDLGRPPMWAREPGFPGLVRIILAQQVSLASANAAFSRLLAVASPLTPERFLALDDVTLKTVGFSRQKTAYGRYLAQLIVERRLNLDSLVAMDDAAARSELMHIKGVGLWTADIYLLMALRRPDIWPRGDLALAVAVQKIKRLASCPTPDKLDAIAARWRPWRAVAARLLWHYYLSNIAARK